jgi:hypothetical protein
MIVKGRSKWKPLLAIMLLCDLKNDLQMQKMLARKIAKSISESRHEAASICEGGRHGG